MFTVGDKVDMNIESERFRTLRNLSDFRRLEKLEQIAVLYKKREKSLRSLRLEVDFYKKSTQLANKRAQEAERKLLLKPRQPEESNEAEEDPEESEESNSDFCTEVPDSSIMSALKLAEEEVHDLHQEVDKLNQEVLFLRSLTGDLIFNDAVLQVEEDEAGDEAGDEAEAGNEAEAEDEAEVEPEVEAEDEAEDADDKDCSYYYFSDSEDSEPTTPTNEERKVGEFGETPETPKKARRVLTPKEYEERLDDMERHLENQHNFFFASMRVIHKKFRHAIERAKRAEKRAEEAEGQSSRANASLFFSRLLVSATRSRANEAEERVNMQNEVEVVNESEDAVCGDTFKRFIDFFSW